MLLVYGLRLQALNLICLGPSQLNGEFTAWVLLIMLLVYGLRLQALNLIFLGLPQLKG